MKTLITTVLIAFQLVATTPATLAAPSVTLEPGANIEFSGRQTALRMQPMIENIVLYSDIDFSLFKGFLSHFGIGSSYVKAPVTTWVEADIHEHNHDHGDEGTTASQAVVNSTGLTELYRDVQATNSAAQTVTFNKNDVETTLKQMIPVVKYEEKEKKFNNTQKEDLDVFFAKLLQHFPSRFTESLYYFTFRASETGSRGLAGGNIMIIRTHGVTEQEMVAVTVHELGHVVDLGMLEGTSSQNSEFIDNNEAFKADDPSLDFYRISWKDTETKKTTAKLEDFVSGYAAASIFEDFSETFAYYVLQGDKFRMMRQYNTALAAKYDFMKNTVFQGKEFSLGMTSEEIGTYSTSRTWDTTILPYDYQGFWNLKI